MKITDVLPITYAIVTDEAEPQVIKTLLYNTFSAACKGVPEHELEAYFKDITRFQFSPSYESIAGKLELCKQELYQLWKTKQNSSTSLSASI